MKNSFKPHALSSALFAALALGAAAFAANSYAAQSTDTFQVTATVEAACTISGTTLDFGTFSTFSGDIDGTSTLTATCTNGSPYTIGLNEGITPSATVTTRQMLHTDASTTLNYTLSNIASGGTNWDDIGGSGLESGTGNGADQTITVYGRIPTGQTAAIVGDYSDTITATIDF